MFYIDYDSIEMSSSGLITGKISIKIEEQYYPEKEWNDLILTILSWWADELESFISDNSKEVNFLFMDGPFEVKLYDINGLTDVIFLNNGREEGLHRIETEELKTKALKGILEAIHSVLNVCNLKKWSNDEIKKLGLKQAHLNLLSPTRPRL
jgi:hypothetical protein